MIFELRLYHVTRGRMADQNSRITKFLPPLFSRHGVRCVGAWNTLAGPASPRFAYLMAFDDFAHREQAWAGFYTDPDWARARSETNAGHEMVERHDLIFLKPHAISQSLPPDASTRAAALYELELQQLAPGQTPGATQFLKETYLPALRENGGHTAGVFDMVSGPGMQQLVMFHAWADAAAWHRGRSAAERSPAMLEALSQQRKLLGSPIFGRSDVSLMEPVQGVPIERKLSS